MPHRRRPSRSTLALRWVGAAVLVLIAIAYVQPLRAFHHARAELAERRADVAVLRAERRKLEQRIAVARTDDFVEREARKLSLVRPGERLFIVTNLKAGP